MALPSISKKSNSTPGVGKVEPWKDSGFEQQYPHLMAFLLLERHDDGSRRVPGTLLFFCEDGALKACLHDRESSRSVFITGATHGSLMLRLEEGLEEDSLEWRAKKK